MGCDDLQLQLLSAVAHLAAPGCIIAEHSDQLLLSDMHSCFLTSHALTISQALSIPVIANGDVYSRDDMSAVKALSGCTSVMLARPALLNCSVFDKAAAALRPQAEVIRAYITHCIR